MGMKTMALLYGKDGEAARRLMHNLKSGKMRLYLEPRNISAVPSHNERESYKHFTELIKTGFYKRLLGR